MANWMMTGNLAPCDTDLMTSRRIQATGAALMVAVALLGCTAAPAPTPSTTSSPTPTQTTAPSTPPPPVIAPVTMDVGDLRGTTVELVVGQALNITTGDLAVDSYSGEVEDPAVAEFVPGRVDGTATYNPGIMALAPGSTAVVLSNADGGIEDVTFDVEVTER